MSEKQQKAIAPSNSGGDRSNQHDHFSHSSHSSKYQLSGKNNPCPICGRTKDGDCRLGEGVVLCHTYVEQDAEVSGYVYRGSKDIWGQYFLSEDRPKKSIRPRSRQEFIYKDVDGAPLLRVTRNDNGEGQKKIFQSHWNGNAWVKGVPPEIRSKLRLYRIEDPINQEAIAKGKPILCLEGEGKVDLALSLGLPATCSIGGAGKWRQYGYPNYLEDLKGAKVVLCPDQDLPGIQHCLEVEQDFPEAQWLYAFPKSPVWERLPKNGGLDLVDWVERDQVTAEQILAAIAPKRPIPLQAPAGQKKTCTPEQTIAQRLLEIAKQGHYFHTPDNTAYVDLVLGDVRQTLPVRGKRFKQWLQYELFTQHGKTSGAESLQQVLGVLEGQAIYQGDTQAVHLRVAAHGEKLYLDLGRDDWQAVEIDAAGWRLVSDYPVRFRRTENLLPLPVPVVGGHLSELKNLLNLDEEAWVLLSTWLLFSFSPSYPHPILVLSGEQGTGKSFTARLLKSFVDPGKAPLIPHVSDLRNLAIQAENRWILAYDNLSHLSADQSDALCRISTGGGFTTRTLYENGEETVFEFIRPQILTSIDDLMSRGDLLERSLLIQLPMISEEARLTEAELEERLERGRGRILGALLTTLSQTLKQLSAVQVERLPRMADFARFAIAAETALGLDSGTFLRVYASNRQEANETALEADIVAIALLRLMEARSTWRGTASELLTELAQYVDEPSRKSRLWPRTPTALGKAFKRLEPGLRGKGIHITRSRGGSRRSLQIDKVALATSQPSQLSEASEDSASGDDRSEEASVSLKEPPVTGDASKVLSPVMLPPVTRRVTPPVTAKMAIGRSFQAFADKSDACDRKKVTHSSCGSWVFSKALDTQVQLLSIGHQTAKIKVPGMGVRDVQIEDLEVVDNSTV